MPAPMKTKGFFDTVSPVLLSANVDVAAGNVGIPSSVDLQYPFRKPILIDEVRWTARVDHNNNVDCGALIYTKLQLGQHYLMRDWVPIWLLSPTIAPSQELSQDVTLTAGNRDFGFWRWKLPEPLYVDAGQVLTSQFQRTLDGFGTMNVQVTYCGRTIAPNQPRPKVIPVPYAAPWVTDLSATATYQISNEKHLFNPFNKPLRIQRFLGRALTFSSNVVATKLAAVTSSPLYATNGVTVQIFDSWGNKVVPTQTGVSDVFDAMRSAWTVDTALPEKGMYSVRAYNLSTAVQAHISMIGVREEAL